MLQSATAVTVTAVAIILLLVKHQKLIMARQNKLKATDLSIATDRNKIYKIKKISRVKRAGVFQLLTPD